MFTLYLLMGIVAVIGLHSLLKWFANVEPSHAKRLMKWLLILGVAAIILLLLRFGLPAIAAIFSGFLALTAIIGRLMVWFPILRMFQSTRQEQSSASTSSSPMTVKEARAILGVEDGATEQEIKDAYLKLMQKVHPDQGGNDYLAKQLNQAKDILLNDKKGSS